MGSRLSRQSSLDNENFSKRRRKLLNSAGESERGGRGGGDFLFALMLKSDKLPGMLRRTNHSPYMRRVAWIKEIQKLLRDRRIDQATDVLKLLRKVRKKPAQGMVKSDVVCQQQRCPKACCGVDAGMHCFPISQSGEGLCTCVNESFACISKM